MKRSLKGTTEELRSPLAEKLSVARGGQVTGPLGVTAGEHVAGLLGETVLVEIKGIKPSSFSIMEIVGSPILVPLVIGGSVGELPQKGKGQARSRERVLNSQLANIMNFFSFLSHAVCPLARGDAGGLGHFERGRSGV